jgi:hypothetical protein
VTLPAGEVRLFIGGSLTASGLLVAGTFTLKISGSELALSATVRVNLKAGSTQVLSLEGSGALLIRNTGIAAKFSLSLRAGGGPAAVLGFTLSATFSLELNTINSAVNTINNVTVSLPAGPYARVAANGTLTVGGFNLTGSFVMSVSSSNISVAADATISLPGLGNALSADANFVIEPTGFAVAINIGGTGNNTRSGSGFSLAGRFILEINTTSTNKTFTRPRMNTTTGEFISGTDSVTIAAGSARLFIGGSLSITVAGASLFKVSGRLELTASASSFTVDFDARMSLLGAHLSVDGTGTIATGANPGVSFSITLKAGTSTTANLAPPGFELSGTFKLEVNTRNVTSSGVSANTFRVSVTNVKLKILGFEMTGSVIIQQSGSIFKITIPNTSSGRLKIKLFNFVNIEFHGYIQSNGVFDINASASITLGTSSTGLTGTISARLSKTASGSVSFSASASGTVKVWGFTIASASASVNSNGRATVTVGTPVGNATLRFDLKNGGRLVDGPVAGATIFFDANFNGTADPGEPMVVSDEQGFYQLEIPLETYDLDGNGLLDDHEGQVVSIGGFDLTNGLVIPVLLRAPAGGLNSGLPVVVSPLSTLTMHLMERGLSRQAAQNAIVAAFDLPFNERDDLINGDPFQRTVEGDYEWAPIYVSNVQLQTMIVQLASLYAGAGGEGVTVVGAQAFDAVADWILTRPAGRVLNPASEGVVAEIIDLLGERSGVQLDPQVAGAAAEVIAATAALMDEVPLDNGSVLVDEVARRQTVGQTSLGDQLQLAGEGEITPSQLRAAATDTALAGLLAAVELPPLDLPADPLPLPRIVLVPLADGSRQATFNFTQSNLAEDAGADLLFEFVVAPVDKQALRPQALVLENFLAEGGPAFYEIRSSLDGFASVLATIETLPGDQSYRVPVQTTDFTGPVTFRIFGRGAADPDATVLIDRVALEGLLVNVPAVPQPGRGGAARPLAAPAFPPASLLFTPAETGVFQPFLLSLLAPLDAAVNAWQWFEPSLPGDFRGFGTDDDPEEDTWPLLSRGTAPAAAVAVSTEANVKLDLGESAEATEYPLDSDTPAPQPEAPADPPPADQPQEPAEPAPDQDAAQPAPAGE